MYVCLCQGVTDHAIRDAVHQGATRMCDLRAQLGVASDCCKCVFETNEIRKHTLSELASPCIKAVA